MQIDGFKPSFLFKEKKTARRTNYNATDLLCRNFVWRTTLKEKVNSIFKIILLNKHE